MISRLMFGFLIGTAAFVVGCSDDTTTVTGPMCVEYRAQDGDTWITVDCDAMGDVNTSVTDAGPADVIEPPLILGNVGQSCDAFTALNAEGVCVQFSWGVDCGSKCPDLPCRECYCIGGRSLNLFRPDGEQCSEFPTVLCSAGKCGTL